MKNIENIKFVINKLVSSPINFGKNINSKIVLIEDINYIKNLQIPFCQNNDIMFKLVIIKEYCNLLNTMHGGAISTLVDISTTIAISGIDKDLRQNVSVDLSTQFLNPIKIDSEILIHCKIPKIGKTLAYSYVDIYNSEDLKKCVTSSHIKAMLGKSWKE